MNPEDVRLYRDRWKAVEKAGFEGGGILIDMENIG